MNVLQRITATVTQSLDSAVCQLENQDAVATAALRQIRVNAANAKVRLAAVERDRDALEAKLKSLNDTAEKWAQRAARVAHEDEAKALECLRRKQHCEAQAHATASALADYESRIHRLSGTVEALQARLQRLSQERNLLRTRESVAQAQKTLFKLQDDDCGGLDAVYERWRARIYATEYLCDQEVSEDVLSREFVKSESDAALRAELAEILATPAAPGEDEVTS